MGLQRCVYITVGISGAGKSTWIKKTSSLLKDNQFLVISPDMERKMLTGDISNQECSGVAFFNCFKQLEKAVNNKDLFTIFWDATNLNTKNLNNIQATIKKSDFDWKVVVVCFECSRDWKLCYDRVESDLKNGVDRSKSNVVSERTGNPIIQDMSTRYCSFVDNVIDDWCKKNNVERVNV